MQKKHLIKKYLVRNERELKILEENIQRFNRQYKIIGTGRMITKLGVKGHVNMHPQDESSNIEGVVLRKDRPKPCGLQKID